MKSNIGAVICDLRRKRGMTQEQLAEAVGVSPPAVSKWETDTSCPDVALLSPIARALDTDVNTLLSFAPTLSQEKLAALLLELQQLAEQDGGAAMERMRESIRRYPNDAALRFQLASFAMGLPSLYGCSEEQQAEALRFSEQGLSFVRQVDDQKLHATATYLLAGLLLNRGELDRAKELLDTLPTLPLSPQTLYTALYQKQGDREKARASAIAQLAGGATAVLNSLAAMASPEYAETEAEALRFRQAYRDVAAALGYPAAQTEIVFIPDLLRAGQTDHAMDQLLKAAHDLMEREVPHLLYGPSDVPEAQYGDYRRQLGRAMRNSLLTDTAFDSVRQDARYLEALHILAPET